MSNHIGKCLMTTLDNLDVIEFGSVINGELVRETIGINYPETATKREYDTLALRELSAVDYVRNVLLGRGMYLAYDNGNYRILLPSENAKQVEQYMGSADKKLSRALKLSKNTPRLADTVQIDQTHARIVMKRESVRTSMQAAA